IPHLLPGALALAAAAGFINTLSLGFFHTPVSHMTGAVSHLGLDVVGGKTADAVTSAGIIIGYIAGAMLAGMVVGAWKLIPSRRYGVTMMIEGGLLGLASYLLLHQHRLALPAVSMACGLQNAMTSSYCGLMIRTTHVTGLVTDIGVMLGHWVRHRQIDRWKLSFLAATFLAFGGGGVLGALADVWFGPSSLAVVGCVCVLAGGLYWFATHRGVVDVMLDAMPQPPRTGSFPND
ncbi:MAG: YoaK family protein, partial [Limisphaerales bacterium]